MLWKTGIRNRHLENPLKHRNRYRIRYVPIHPRLVTTPFKTNKRHYPAAPPTLGTLAYGQLKVSIFRPEFMTNASSVPPRISRRSAFVSTHSVLQVHNYDIDFIFSGTSSEGRPPLTHDGRTIVTHHEAHSITLFIPREARHLIGGRSLPLPLAIAATRSHTIPSESALHHGPQGFGTNT